MEFRYIGGHENEEARYIWSQAFEGGNRQNEWFEDWRGYYEDVTNQYAVFDKDGMQAAFMVLDETMHFGTDSLLRVGTVNGVACLPAARGKGYASYGLKKVYEAMREKGQVLSILEPFNWDFYANLGYAWCGRYLRIHLPPRILTTSPETEKVRAATDEDRDAIISCYTELAKQFRGMLRRRDAAWNRFLTDTSKKHTYCYVYEHEGKLEGYLFHTGWEKKETRIGEFIALTPRAKRGLLGLLKRMEMQVDKLCWDIPLNDILPSLIYHWEIEAKMRTHCMVRVVDVAQALQGWQPQTEKTGRVAFAIRDDSAPWNNGTWLAEFEASRTTVQPTDASPTVSMDIQAFSQAFHGEPTLERLRAADRIIVHDEAGYATLNALLEGPPMFCRDTY